MLSTGVTFCQFLSDKNGLARYDLSVTRIMDSDGSIDGEPSEEQLAAFDEEGCDDGMEFDGLFTEDGDLLGLYDGVSLYERGEGYGEFGMDMPDTITIYQGIALVMGENIGTTVTANLAAMSANTQARRTAMAHLLFNVFGVLWVLAFFFPFVRMVCGFVGLDPTADSQSPTQLSFALAAFHTAFNVINTAVLIWFIPQIEKLVCWIVKPARQETEEEFHLQFINSGIMKTPEISVLQAQKEISVFGENMQKMLGMVKELSELKTDDEFHELFIRIKKYEDTSDKMENEIGRYLGQVGEAHLSDETKEKIRGMLRQIGELESIGDSCFNLARIIQRKKDNNVDFAEAQEKSIMQMYDLVDGAMSRMNTLLKEQKETLSIVPSTKFEASINSLRNELKQKNITDLDNHVYNYDNGTVYMDLVNEYEKVGDYVLNVAEARLGYSFQE